jgi:hypothetical protein
VFIFLYLRACFLSKANEDLDNNKKSKMKKFAFLSMAALVAFAACKKETEPEATPYPTDGLTPSSNQKALVFEATGAWCQWCPRGAELMLRINGTYEDDVVALALHGGNGTDALKNPTATALLNQFLPGTGFPGFFVQNEETDEGDVLGAIDAALLLKPVLGVTHKVVETDTSFNVYAKVEFFKDALNEEFMVQSYLVLNDVEARDYGSGIDLNQISVLPYVATGSGSQPTRWTEDKGIVNNVPTVKAGESFYHKESVISQGKNGPMGIPLKDVNPFGTEYIEGDILGTKNTPIVLVISKQSLPAVPFELDFSAATIVWKLRQDGSGKYDYVNGYFDHSIKK